MGEGPGVGPLLRFPAPKGETPSRVLEEAMGPPEMGLDQGTGRGVDASPSSSRHRRPGPECPAEPAPGTEPAALVTLAPWKQRRVSSAQGQAASSFLALPILACGLGVSHAPRSPAAVQGQESRRPLLQVPVAHVLPRGSSPRASRPSQPSLPARGSPGPCGGQSDQGALPSQPPARPLQREVASPERRAPRTRLQPSGQPGPESWRRQLASSSLGMEALFR